jgi:hypothetical protein
MRNASCRNGGWLLLLLLLVWGIAVPGWAAGDGKVAAAPPAEPPGEAAQPAAENPLAKYLQRAYYYVYEGNRLDLQANQKLAATHQQEAEKLKRGAEESKAKQKAYEAHLELARLYAELSKHNTAIIQSLEVSGHDLESQAAMEAIPKLERQIEAITGKKVEREWLTFEEVQVRQESGMQFKTEAPDILPYAVHHWYTPGKDGKDDDHKKSPPRKEPPK